MRVYCVADKSIMAQNQEDEGVPKTLTLLTREMLNGGIWANASTRSPHQNEYQRALSALLSLECEDALCAMVVMDWHRGKLNTNGFTWLWIVRSGKILFNYARTPAGKRCRSFLDTVAVGRAKEHIPKTHEDWIALFGQDIQGTVRLQAA